MFIDPYTGIYIFTDALGNTLVNSGVITDWDFSSEQVDAFDLTFTASQFAEFQSACGCPETSIDWVHIWNDTKTAVKVIGISAKIVALTATVLMKSVSVDDHSERCRQVKNQCIADCSDFLPTQDHGWTFYRCLINVWKMLGAENHDQQCLGRATHQ